MATSQEVRQWNDYVRRTIATDGRYTGTNSEGRKFHIEAESNRSLGKYVGWWDGQESMETIADTPFEVYSDL